MRILLQPAYVLHHRPYRDTSRILELFTLDHGRISVFARGARGARKASSSLVSMLQPFNRLLVSWSGRGEAGQLIGAELDGAVSALPPDRLVSGFYLNELLLKLFARHDAHADVFHLYTRTIEALKVDSNPLRCLRVFEKRLLESIGYGLALHDDALSGEPLDPRRSYHYRLDRGAVRTQDIAEGSLIFSGASLLSLAREDLADTSACNDARRLLRAALERVLDGAELRTRRVMLDLRSMRDDGAAK